jgi:hypothetical protein
MRIPFSHSPPERWLSRSQIARGPLSDLLQTLIPAGEEVPYQQVHETLAGHLLGELGPCVSYGWDVSLLWTLAFCRADAARQLNDAVRSGQLRLRQVVVPQAPRYIPASRWVTALRHRFGVPRVPHKHPVERQR